jgi:hypothetical protein
MSVAADLFRELTGRGVKLAATGQKLTVVAPVGAVDQETRRRLVEYKAELLAMLHYGSKRVSESQLTNQARDSAQSLESVLKSRAIELWSDALGERFWLVADEEDAKQLRKPRGEVYTAAEVRRLVQVHDPAVVAEIHRWKREFNATVAAFESHKGKA